MVNKIYKNSLAWILLGIFLPSVIFATEFTSTSFQVLDPVIQPGGYSTSSTYSLNGVIAQIAIGTSTASSFKISGGFLFYPFVSSTTLFANAGDGRVYLGWTTPSGFLGWTPSGYTVGQSTVPGGPYAYTSIGNYGVSERTGLTNGTTYYFVVRIEDALGNFIATSSEAYAAPTANVLAVRTIQLPTTSASSTVFVNSNSTQLAIAFPSDFFSSCGNVHTTIFSESKSVATADKPLPSGKEAANTFYDVSFKCSSTAESITSLDKNLTLTFTYTDSDVSGINESTLVPYHWNGSSWAAISGATVDTAANTITVSTNSFSPLALLGTAPAPTPSPAPSGGGDSGGIPVINRGCGIGLDCGGKVSVRDLSIFLASGADINGDGKADVRDVSIFLTRAKFKFIAVREEIARPAKQFLATISEEFKSKTRLLGVQKETAVSLLKVSWIANASKFLKDVFHSLINLVRLR